MIDYALLARARKMLTDEATELHTQARIVRGDDRVRVALHLAITAEACQYAADSLHNVLSKADAFLDDEQAREALRHE
jgi:hypothetical protein